MLGIYRMLKSRNLVTDLHIHDLVPSYNALAVHFDPVLSNPEVIIKKVEKIIEQQLEENRNQPDSLAASGKKFLIPVDYSGDDLGRVAEINGLSTKEVIELHTQSHYVVAMVGFIPHFPYLIGLDKQLETPRLDNPRTIVPAGSVAIGGAQTGIYPRESPGGWNILGFTDPELLKAMEPGDSIEFKQVEET